MSRRIDALYDVLEEACKEQFGFAPERVQENLQYMGAAGAMDKPVTNLEDHVSPNVHRFRDLVRGTEIHLSLHPVKATLLESANFIGQGWPEKLQAEYCKTDVQIKAERDARDAKVKYTLESPLWAKIGSFVRTQFPGHETSDDGAISGISLYRLVEDLAEKGDSDFAAFAEHIGEKKAEELSWYLAMAYQREHELMVWEKVKAHPNIKTISNMLDLIPGSRLAGSRVDELAYEVCDSIPEYREESVDKELIVLLVMRNRVAMQPAPPEEDSPAP